MLSCLHQGGSPGPFCSPPLSQRDRRRIEQMKLTRAAAAELKGENVEVVGFGGKAVAASAGLPDGWSAAVDGDGDTYYVRSQPCHLPRCCNPLPELDPASAAIIDLSAESTYATEINVQEAISRMDVQAAGTREKLESLDATIPAALQHTLTLQRSDFSFHAPTCAPEIDFSILVKYRVYGLRGTVVTLRCKQE